MREHSGTGAPGIVIRRIDKTREADVSLPNEPFHVKRACSRANRGGNVFSKFFRANADFLEKSP